MAQTGRSGLNSATQRNARKLHGRVAIVAKLRGIVDSKGRYQTYLRNQGLSAPPIDGWHVPSPAEDGTLICGCVGSTMRYSPVAFAAHVAGRPPADSHYGAYTTGPLDPWVIERERRPLAPAIEPIDVHVDDAGNSWEPFLDEYQRRQLRCVSGARIGDVIHAPAMILAPAPAVRRTQIADGVDNSYDF